MLYIYILNKHIYILNNLKTREDQTKTKVLIERERERERGGE